MILLINFYYDFIYLLKNYLFILSNNKILKFLLFANYLIIIILKIVMSDKNVKKNHKEYNLLIDIIIKFSDT